jgi:MFS family permease
MPYNVGLRLDGLYANLEIVFVNVDIGTVIWGALIEELGFTVQDLTWSFGFNTAGLAVGCILFIPFALKYGRRIMYVVSYSRLPSLH